MKPRANKPLDFTIIGLTAEGKVIVRDTATGDVDYPDLAPGEFGRPLTPIEKHICGGYGDETD